MLVWRDPCGEGWRWSNGRVSGLADDQHAARQAAASAVEAHRLAQDCADREAKELGRKKPNIDNMSRRPQKMATGKPKGNRRMKRGRIHEAV